MFQYAVPRAPILAARASVFRREVFCADGGDCACAHVGDAACLDYGFGGAVARIKQGEEAVF